jgi:hypothetical protein
MKVDRALWVAVAALLSPLAVTESMAVDSPAPRQNMVYLLADDLGWHGSAIYIPMIEGEPEEYPRSSLDHSIDPGMVAQIDKCDLGITRSFRPIDPLLGVNGEAIVR